jgi:hypothetical protein
MIALAFPFFGKASHFAFPTGIADARDTPVVAALI